MLNSEPPEELLLEDELLDEDELLELDELEEELLDELLGVGLVFPPPQAARAADKAVTPQVKKILFMIRSRIKYDENRLDIDKTISPIKTLFDRAMLPDRLLPPM